jgi:hypothetical protein
MTPEQPLALRLADDIDAVPEIGADPDMLQDAAAELRRLHAENEAMREALAVMLRDYTAVHDIGDVEMQPAIYQARAALARAGEKK